MRENTAGFGGTLLLWGLLGLTGAPPAVSQADAHRPDWLSLEGSYRLRYESLDGPFRRGAAGSDQALAQRLLVAVEADFDSIYAAFELQDSRTWLDDTGTPIGTDDVNTVEPLQAYIGVRRAGDADGTGRLDLRIGRMTMDLGGRRLLARNRFRNTLDAFTGARVDWQAGPATDVQAFVVTPVQRLPVLPSRLRDNDQKLDEEHFDDLFWGVFLARGGVSGATGEVYFVGLNERRTVDRDLYTLGARWFSAPAPDTWDFEFEVALQGGTSPDMVVDPRRGLDHRAGFVHLQAARSVVAPWAPRVVLQADAVTGDRDPGDGDHERFDTLFGDRRFEFGPTGIYGALDRSNLLTPGLRLELKPGPSTSLQFGYRAAWLASRRDTWASGLLRDPAGDSGRFLGHQWETRLRYVPRGGRLELELGGAYLDQGRFVGDAPGAVGRGHTTYGYLEAALPF